jgi:hypothetical protein
MVRTCLLLLASALASTFAVGAKGQLAGRSGTVVVQSGSLKLRAQLWRPSKPGIAEAVRSLDFKRPGERGLLHGGLRHRF